MNHCAVHLKLTQHCKPILQFLKNAFKKNQKNCSPKADIDRWTTNKETQYHVCLHTSELIKLYILNMCSSLYTNYISIKPLIFFKIEQ